LACALLQVPNAPSRLVAEGFHYRVGIDEPFPGPRGERTSGREVYGCGEQHEVLEVLAWEEGGVHNANRAALAVAKEGEVLRARVPQGPVHGPREVVEDVVLEGEILVLIARDAPVEHVDVEALS
jgi:hypothetical protein